MFYIKRMQSNCDFGFAIQKTTSRFAIQNYENDKLLLKTICLGAIEINGFQEVEKNTSNISSICLWCHEGSL